MKAYYIALSLSTSYASHETKSYIPQFICCPLYIRTRIHRNCLP